jgi:lipoprotein NlpI
MPFKIRGAHFLKENEIDQAAAELEQAANLNAGDIEVQLMLGSTQLQRGQSEAAVRAFSSALVVDPNNAEALRGRATAYGQKQNDATAITDYTAALNINGEDVVALEGRGAALLRIGAFAAAANDLHTLLALTPENNTAVFFRANARFQNGDSDGAVADFSAILSRQPDNADALLGRGIAREFAGDYVGADADFTTLLEAAPDAAQPLANRGYVRVMAGAFSAASEDLMKAVSLPNAPKHLALWKFVAEARAGTSRPDTLTSAMRGMDSTQWPAPLMRYFLGEADGDAVISAAIEIPELTSGRLCETYFFLGQAALILSDTTEAQRLFKAAIDTGAVRFTEYAGAMAELSRMTKTNE